MESARTPEKPIEAVAPPVRGRSRRWLRLCAGALAVGLVAVAAAVFGILPWMAQRGDLNHIVEGIISSILDVPVRIDSIDSEPLGRLSLTRLRSVSAESEEKLRFGAQEISLAYDPVELLRGEIRELRFTRPSLFINLDEDLSDLAFLPRFPQPGKSDGGSPLDLPFTVRSVVIDQGEAIVRFEGRELEVADLLIRVEDLGSDEGLGYEIRARVLDAEIAVSGELEIVPRDGDGVDHRLPDSEITIDGVRASTVLPWLRHRPHGSGHPDEDRLVERVDELVHSAELGLSGTLQGTLFEHVSLQLETRLTDLTVGDPESIGVSRGRVDVRFEADVFGLLERLSFRLDVLARGTVEAGARSRVETASLGVHGSFSRQDPDAPTLLIDSASIGLVDGGEVALTGRITPLFRDEPAELAVVAELTNLRTSRLLDLLPHETISSLPVEIQQSRGEFGGRLDIAGTLEEPVVGGRLDVSDSAVNLRGIARTFGVDGRVELEMLRVDRARQGGSLGRLELSVDPFDAGELEQVLEAYLPGSPELEGSVALTLELLGSELSAAGVDGRLRVHARLSDGGVELEDDLGGLLGVKADVDLRLGIDRSPRVVPFAADLRLEIDELLIGDIYAQLAGEPVVLQLAGEVELGDESRLETVKLPQLKISTPLTGPVEGRAGIRRDSQTGELRVSSRLEARSLPTRRAFEAFVREPYSNVSSMIESSRLEGETRLTLDVEGTLSSPDIVLGVALSDVTLQLGNLVVDGLSGSLPLFLAGSRKRDRDSTLAFESLRWGRVELPASELELHFDERGFELSAPVSLPLFGGRVNVSELSFAVGEEPGPRLTVRASGEGLLLEEITRAYGLPILPGKIRFDFEPLVYQGGGLSVQGALVAEVFEGTVTFSDLSIDDVLEPYGSLRLAEGRVENLRLLPLGRAFHFGLVSGVLRGSLRDLEFTSGSVTGFRLRAQTVSTSGVPQYIDRRAIESIRAVLAGPLGAVEETVFGKFYFDRFGIDCLLEDETFYLRGIRSEDGVDYLMFGRWYQFPRVDIVNARPDQPYDWASVVENLRSIYHGEFSFQEEQ